MSSAEENEQPPAKTESSFMARHIEEGIKDEQNQPVEAKKKTISSILKKILSTISYRLRIWNKYHFIFAVFVIAITVPTLIFIFAYDDYAYDKEHTCDIKPSYQIPCGEENIKETKCFAINCCYNASSNICYHSVPSKYTYSAKASNWKDGFYPSLPKSPFGKNAIKVYLGVSIENEVVSLTLSKNPIGSKRDDLVGDNFKVKLFPEIMELEIRRKSNDQMLLSTSHGPAIASEGYWEWTLDLNAKYLYGLNDFRFEDNATTTRVVYQNGKEHGVVPRFLAFNGDFYGVSVKHLGPLEIKVLPSKMIVLRMLSGEDVRVDLVMGPTPEDVLRQQRTEVVVPPYWALGVHICRDGNITSVQSTLDEFLSFTNIAAAYHPFIYESDCVHENLFAINIPKDDANNVKAALDTLYAAGKKFVMSLAPQVLADGASYETAKTKDVLYKFENSSIVLGTYLNRTVGYPDFSKPVTGKWFAQSFADLKTKFGVTTIDGFVLRSNWPANENRNSIITNKSDFFDYLPKDLLAAMSHTVPWYAESDKRKHIALHNNYGRHYAQAVAALRESSFLLSAAFTGEDLYGSHVQNVNATWDDLKNALSKTLSQSLFGSYSSSVPVCGSTKVYEESNEALCSRWYLTAATFPIFRISSDLPRRHPLSLPSNQLKEIAILSIKIRYLLLPYYYTVLSEKLPLLRPMLFNYPSDEKTFKLDEQYMIGRSLLVAQPMMYSPLLSVYLPANPSGWFEFWTGTAYPSGLLNITAVESDMFMYVAAGHVIPYTEISDTVLGNNAEKLRKTPLNLLSALHCEKSCTSSGNWCVAEGTCLKFDTTETSLKISKVLQLKKLLCDPNVDKIATSLIDKVKIFRKGKKSNWVNVNVELCSENDDVIVKNFY